MARGDKGIVIEGAGDKGETPSAAEGTKTDVVRFWSTHKRYTVAVAPGRNRVFKDHALVLGADDADVVRVRSLGSPYIKEVLDEPFVSDEDLAKFNKFLQSLVYAGEYNAPSKRGILAVIGILGDNIDLNMQPDVLLMKVLKTKSFKEGI